MQTKDAIVLGISVGTHTIGMALVKHHVLYNRQMKTFTGEWSPLKLRRITLCLERYLDEYHVTVVAMKIPDSTQNTKALRQLESAFVRICENRNIPVHRFTIQNLKDHALRANKRELMDYATSVFPELMVVYKKQQQTRNTYYVKLFEAVVTAIACIRSI